MRYNSHCIVFVPIQKYENVTMATCSTKLNPDWSLSNVDDQASLKFDRMEKTWQTLNISNVALSIYEEVASFDKGQEYSYIACEDRAPVVFSSCSMNQTQQWTVINLVFDDELLIPAEKINITVLEKADHITNQMNMWWKTSPVNLTTITWFCERPSDPGNYQKMDSFQCSSCGSIYECLMDNEKFRPKDCNPKTVIEEVIDGKLSIGGIQVDSHPIGSLHNISTSSNFGTFSPHVTRLASHIRINSIEYGPIKNGLNAVYYDSDKGLFLFSHYTADELVARIQIALLADRNDALFVVFENQHPSKIITDVALEKLEEIAIEARLINCEFVLPSESDISYQIMIWWDYRAINGELLKQRHFDIVCHQKADTLDFDYLVHNFQLPVYGAYLTMKDLTYPNLTRLAGIHGKKDGFEVYGDLAVKLTNTNITYDAVGENCQALSIETKNDFASVMQYFDTIDSEWIFVEMADIVEVSTLIIPGQTIHIIQTKPPFATLPVSEETRADLVCSVRQPLIYESEARDSNGMKYYIGQISYKSNDLNNQSFIDKLFEDIQTGGAGPKLFEPINQKELDFVRQTFFNESASLFFPYVFKDGFLPNGTVLSLIDYGIQRATNDQYGRPIFQVNLDPGVKEVNIATKLKFEIFNSSQTSSFCRKSTVSSVLSKILIRDKRSIEGSCEPDSASSNELMEQIINKTRSIFPDKVPTIKLNSWESGSIVCDYEIKFLEPLRLTKVSSNAAEKKSSMMDTFLARARAQFADMKNNDDFTNAATSEAERIVCDGDDTFACDYGQNLNQTWLSAIERAGACLPIAWRCDGIVQCPTATDEMNCTSINSPSIDINQQETRSLYLAHTYSSHLNYPSHYEKNQNWTHTYQTGSDMMFVLHFIELTLEYGSERKCRDWIEIQFDTTLELNMTESINERICGNLENIVFLDELKNGKRQGSVHNLNRKWYIPANKFTITFNSNGNNHFKGHLIRIESIPLSFYYAMALNQLDSTTFGEVYQCENPILSLIPRNKQCDGIVDCQLGDDESLTECIDQNKWTISDLSLNSFTSFPSSNGNTQILQSLFAIDQLKIPPSLVTIESNPKNLSYFCDQSSTAIPHEWLCDGVRDCALGDDEIDCIGGIQEVPHDFVNAMCDDIGYKVTIEPGKTYLFSHNSYPDNYLPNSKCKWQFISSQPIKLTMLKFLLPDKRGCFSDKLSVYDGPNYKSPLMGTYCQLPTYIPLHFTSSRNSLFVDFSADSSIHGNFLFHVRVTDSVRQADNSCYTVSSEYLGTQSDNCEVWPLEQIGMAPDQKLKPQWDSISSSRLVATRINQIWESNSHNYCRAVENTVAKVNSNSPTKCYLNQTVSDCSIPQCRPNCPKGYFSCRTGDCIPISQVCNKRPECRLREDELLSCKSYSFSSLTKAISQTSCSYSFMYQNGLVFTNNGFQVPTDYIDGTVCVYYIDGVQEDAELTINYEVEKLVSFRGHEDESCFDYILVRIGNEPEIELCGTDTTTILVSSGSSVELVLVSDLGGKYDQMADLANYGMDVTRNPLACCASDCDSNVVCNCPRDQGRFEVEMKSSSRQRRSVVIAQADQWTGWYSDNVPSGVQVAG